MADKIISPFGGFVVYPDERGNIFQRLLGHERRRPGHEPSAMTPLVDIYGYCQPYADSILNT